MENNNYPDKVVREWKADLDRHKNLLREQCNRSQDLKAELAEAEKVISYYAEGWNWFPFEDKSESEIWDNDRSYFDDRPPMRSCKEAPGKKAREYLAKKKGA